MSAFTRLRGSFALDRVSPRDRRALRLGLLIAVPVLLWTAVVRPWRAALEDTRDLIEAERGLLVREEALIASTSTLPAAVYSAQQQAEHADGRLVRAANIALVEAAVTDVLETLAAQSRVLLEEMRGMQPDRRSTGPAGVQPIRLTVQGESDLDGVTRFLHGIEENRLLLRIAELSIDPVAADAQTGTGGPGRSNQPPPPQQPGVVRFAMIVVAYAPPDLPGGAAPEPTEQVP